MDKNKQRVYFLLKIFLPIVVGYLKVLDVRRLLMGKLHFLLLIIELRLI